MIKKNILTFIILILVSLNTKAQIGESRNDLAIGINAGYSLNKITFNPSIKQRLKGAPTFGLTARYTCEKYFLSLCAIQMELNYANLGWDELIETSDDKYKRDIHYIQCPILARMGWGYEEKGAMCYFIAGPQFGYCIGETEYKEGLFNEETLNKRPGLIYQQYNMPIEKKFDYGITAGLGLEINTKRVGHFLLEGRYYFALSDIYGNGKKDYFGRSANGTIYIKASYLFDIIRTKK